MNAIPMTIAEYVALDKKDDKERRVEIQGYRESPFQMTYRTTWTTFDVQLTDLPVMSDLPKAEGERAQAAYLTLRDLTYNYLKALKAESRWRYAPDTLKRYQEACYSPIGTHDEWVIKRTRDLMLDVLARVLSPRTFFVAVQAVCNDMEDMQTGAARYLEDFDARLSLEQADAA